MDGVKWVLIIICFFWVVVKWSFFEREFIELLLFIFIICIVLFIYYGLCGCYNVDDFVVKKIYLDVFLFLVMFRFF